MKIGCMQFNFRGKRNLTEVLTNLSEEAKEKAPRGPNDLGTPRWGGFFLCAAHHLRAAVLQLGHVGPEPDQARRQVCLLSITSVSHRKPISNGKLFWIKVKRLAIVTLGDVLSLIHAATRGSRDGSNHLFERCTAP